MKEVETSHGSLAQVSHVSRQLLVFTMSFDLFIILSVHGPVSLVIFETDYLGFGFMTLNCEPNVLCMCSKKNL